MRVVLSIPDQEENGHRRLRSGCGGVEFWICPVQQRFPVVRGRWHDKSMPKATAPTAFALAIEYYREEDGRWLADIPALPGVTAYGRTRRQVTAAVQALALRLIADRLEHGEAVPGPMNVSFIAA